MTVSKKTEEVLKKAGWYEDRKIDITENKKFLEERGFKIFPAALKFMEAFGELEINFEKTFSNGSKYRTKHTTCIKEIIGLGDSSCFGLENFIDHDNNFIEEMVMPVAALYNREIVLYITKSGKLYRDTGWIGDNIWQAWDNIILENGGRIWKEIRY